ncbi:isocyanide synthase family protein [Streptosporangium sp. NPDC020072]|uniref:isocyanide synthase family protein n=1 Tax=Streptosporangium sp. NPDC020072 TaxID=3154788 RepID=UPI00343E83FC
MNGNLTSASNSIETSRKLLEILYRYQRVDSAPDDVGETTGGELCAACCEARKEKLAYFIENGEPIHFVIPAFPAKSPNLTKVIGALPDLGEHMALALLQSICDYTSYFYPPGARITICSDGHVFGDVVGVSDNTVSAYRASLTNMIRMSNWKSLEMFGLDDAFGGTDYPKLRQTLEYGYTTSLEELKESVRTDRNSLSLFNGIHRFMFEDALARNKGETSKTKLRKESKDAAYQTIRRSNAWSRVVAENFPRAMRLSIHPQPPHSEKFGLRLMRTQDSWLTPWHGVVLDDGVKLSLVKRWEAEDLKASVVLRNGRPSHFVGPHLTIAS